ncbi:MAG: hypothetical protein IT178_18930 [Acidobacteria bacterium]|nr:hypothetical protein [Acidobacteriota bacterium]
MIAAAIVPGCPAAWQVALHTVVSRGWLTDLPLMGSTPPLVWLGLPSLIVSGMAILLAVRRLPRALLIVIGASAFAHPLLPLVLLPLLGLTLDRTAAVAAVGASGSQDRGFAAAVSAWAPAIAVSAILVATSVWMTPSCGALAGGLRSVLPGDITAWLGVVLGLGGGALVLMDVVFADRGDRASHLVVSCMAVVIAIVTTRTLGADVAAMTAVATAVLWWMAARGARRIIRWQMSALDRAGATFLVIVAMFVVFGHVSPLLPRGFGGVAPALWASFDALPHASAIVFDEWPASSAAVVWRARHADSGLTFVPASEESISRAIGRSAAVYAWPPTVQRLALRGFSMAAANDAGLARITGYTPCVTLTPAWTNLSSTLASGRFAGEFPGEAREGGVLVYLTLESGAVPRPEGWPPEAVQDFQARRFDREDPASVAALNEALARDHAPPQTLGSGRFVVRVHADRHGSAPRVLAIVVGAPVERAWGRAYAGDERPPELRPAVCAGTSRH